MGAKCCRREQDGAPAGSVLDQVISQASDDDQTILYKIANYKKGGLLLETYARGGQSAAEQLIREQFAAYMYAGGRGQLINRAEYLRWKFRDQDHVVLPIEASLSRHDPLARWSDHEACWQMRYRGVLGESLLHLLIICDTKIHTRLARTLLKCFPRLSLDVVEGEEYLGSSSLHLAIAYSNNELVQDLVEAGADVCQRAIGSFFLPRDQQRSLPARHTDYEGLAYLGEYPLAWAACCANESVYNLLLDSGADPDLPDSFGNMILHMVVVCDKLDMFGYALRHPKLPASNGKVNAAGLTPLTLACQLGRAEVFREMLELSAREFWRYSNITCSAYPLNALDTLLPDGRTNWNSALFIILNGTKEAHLDMLDGGIIQRLLEEKWKTFARNQFLKRLLILFVHLLLVSAAVYLRPAHGPLLAAAASARDVTRYVCELAALAGVLSYVLLQQGDELRNQGPVAFVKQLGNAPAKAIFLLSNFLILACVPCRLTGNKRAEEAILLFAVPGSWFLLMFFAGAVRLTGPFVTMIYSMITGDMLTFGIIYSIVLFGFSQSFFFLYKGFPNVKSSLYASYPSTWMALFQITLGDYTYSDLGLTTYPNLAKTVFALFMVFVPILLLNMLIAMMGNTYAHVIEQSEKEWMKQWAKIVVTLERAVPQTDAHRYLQEYSIGLGPGDQPRVEQRAVMVIKSKAKTRAKQRKGAVSNWKRVGKVTITELRRRGMTGEDLRRLMWGRASISTPTKIPIKPATDGLLPADSHNVAGGFGSALVSALDVMAFTHDLDLSTAATGLNLQSAAKASTAQTTSNAGAASAAPRAPSATPQIDAGGSIVGMLNQIGESQVPAIAGGATQLTGAFVPQFSTGQVQQIAAGQMPQYATGQGAQYVVGQAPQFAAGQVQQFGAAPTAQFTAGAPNAGGFVAHFGGGAVPQAPGFSISTPAPGFVTPTPAPGFVTPTPGPGFVAPTSASGFVIPTQAGTVAQFGGVSPGMTGVGPTFVTAPGFAVTAATTPAIVSSSQQHRDWLRELVLLSEATGGAGDALLRQLAAEAANLDHVTEVTIVKKPGAARSARCAVAGAMSGLFGVEARGAPALSWTQERATARLEPSDSEGFGETPLLGRISRTRRARSATRRRTRGEEASDSYRPERAAFLCALADTDSGDASAAPRPDADLEYAALRIRQLRGDGRSEAEEGGPELGGLDLKDVRPLVIQQAAMTAAMETIAENALIFKGEGAGVEVEGANQPSSARLPSDKKKHDRKRKPRPKTAKINRVSPMETRRGRSASARHPLRHWSVAALAPMSRLLRSEPSVSDETP